jgi:hypothetical protein
VPVEEGPAITEREKRARTVASLVRTVGTSLVLLLAVMMVFREIGLDITPLIAGAGVMGLAIGFGAQSLAEATSPFSPRYRRSKGPAAYLAVVEEVAKLLEERHG